MRHSFGPSGVCAPVQWSGHYTRHYFSFFLLLSSFQHTIPEGGVVGFRNDSLFPNTTLGGVGLSTNARVMTPFGPSKGALNYLYSPTPPLLKFLLYKIAGTQPLTPIRMSKRPTNYKFLWTPKRAAIAPIDLGKLNFDHHISPHLIADTGAMTAIGVRMFGCGNSVHPK